MIKVHGVPLSPFVRKVLLVLDYKGVDYDVEPVFPGAEDPAFRAISPLGKIPVLEHDGFFVPDTSVICRYLDRVFPDNPIFPTDPQAEATATWIEEFADSKLIEACAGLFVQRFLNPKMMQTEPDEAVIQDILENRMPQVLDYLESIIPAEGLLLGELSIADFAVVTCFIQAEYGDFKPDPDRYPGLARYLTYTLDSDIVKNRIAAERAALPNLF